MIIAVELDIAVVVVEVVVVVVVVLAATAAEVVVAAVVIVEEAVVVVVVRGVNLAVVIIMLSTCKVTWLNWELRLLDTSQESTNSLMFSGSIRPTLTHCTKSGMSSTR
ncbi:hypothetical protein ElyMa_006034900 [Elysia marginata]|uniref:Uncharacterized protein n=1 Tax=Elysia marginata TaxID=1093978 RepID=A0AAV4GJR4_9GAST|nr:hypothetical protein ElyMa_006034900 [Elysia marginata]